MKKIGIVCDNYKLNKFKKELAKKGFNDLKTLPFTEATTGIFIEVEDNVFQKKQREVAAISEIVELHFKRSN